MSADDSMMPATSVSGLLVYEKTPTKVELYNSTTEAIKTRTILERQKRGLAEIQARLVALDTRQRQLAEDISVPVVPTARQPSASADPTAPAVPAVLHRGYGLHLARERVKSRVTAKVAGQRGPQQK